MAIDAWVAVEADDELFIAEVAAPALVALTEHTGIGVDACAVVARISVDADLELDVAQIANPALVTDTEKAPHLIDADALVTRLICAVVDIGATVVAFPPIVARA